MVAEAQRLAADAGAQHVAAAKEAECPTAEAAKTERASAAAEDAMQQHCSRAVVAEPGTPAALGSVGVVFSDLQQALIAQMETWALLQLITVRATKLCAAPLRR